jgi:hypothetical protein
MRARLSLTLLLLVAATVQSASPPLVVEPGPPAAPRETELAPEEEREARALAVRFMQRLKATDDFGPLVDEFFVGDFPERFKRLLKEKRVKDEDLGVFTLRVLLRASHNDLRRAYIALLNFFNQNDLLNDAAKSDVAVANGISDWSELFSPRAETLRWKVTEDALTPEFFATVRSDPALVAFAGLFLMPEAESNEAIAKELGGYRIRTLAQFRRSTARLEKCAGLMKAAVRKLRDAQKILGPPPQAISGRDRDKYLIYKFWASALESDSAGYPAGTHLVVARIFPFEMQMIRQGGQFRMLAVYPDLDGD